VAGPGPLAVDGSWRFQWNPSVVPLAGRRVTLRAVQPRKLVMIPATLKQEALELLIVTARAVLQREERPTQTSKRTKRPLPNLCAIA
jgi:hypothetical protein